jgi:outer membrane protein OmpA-like peptidoglycan-associated protein
MRRNGAAIAVVLAVALMGSTGCVSKKMFRQNVADTDTRISTVESGVEANEKRIGDLRTETDSKLQTLDGKTQRAMEVGQGAMTKAEAAEKLARGRMLWEVTLTDDKVKFSFNQATIPADAAAILDDLANKIRGYDKTVYVEIEGHTDSAGSEDYNYELGLRRAETVRNYLAKQGVPLHAMNVISYGETVPVADNSTSTGRSQNRRVVVRVLE